MVLTVILLAGLVGGAEAADTKLSQRMTRILDTPDPTVKSEAGTYGVWVRFADRGLDATSLAVALQEAEAELSARTAARRAKMGGSLITENDLALNAAYVQAVQGTGAVLRRESRWLNSASFDATKAQITALADLPFVVEVDLVARFRKDRVQLADEERAALEQQIAAARAEKSNRWSHDYGGGAPAAELINLPRVHDQGLTGKGVVIGVIDTGYDLDWHESMQHLDVLATWDFINDREDVGDYQYRDPEEQSLHGTECLSVLAAYSEGDNIGVAWEASYVLAKTERIDVEVRLEEDAWIAALEWAEGLGVDIVSSAIGYYEWYTDEDLDGGSAPITLAADLAVSRGVTVLVSAGANNGVLGIPRMNAPADGRKVITVGAATLDGYPTETTSRGPTWDGRIKPDVLGCGQGILVSSWWVEWVYTLAAGSSYANAQIAGVAALILQQDPDLTPLQVREALRMTASRATWPDNDYGWGLVDAHAAVNYWGPAITHTPITRNDNFTDPLAIDAEITSRTGVNDDDVTLTWKDSFEEWHRAGMIRGEGDFFRAEIPPAIGGTIIQYYIEASDGSGNILTHPLDAPDNLHLIVVSSDGRPPVIQHFYLQDQLLAEWPPVLRAEATDNMGIEAVELRFQLNGGSEQGPFVMSEGDIGYEMAFPLEAGSLAVGDVITYTVTARDISNNGNERVTGPFDFRVVDTRARVLLIDDSNSLKSFEGELPENPHAGAPEPAGISKSAPEDIESWLLEMGFEVVVILSSDVKKGSLNGFDVVVLSSGSTWYPIMHEELKNQLILWARAGGKLLIEGGETAYAATGGLASPDFLESVLHISGYWGEGGYTTFQTHGQEDHPMAHRPNRLPHTIELEVPYGYAAYNASDIVEPTADAVSLYSAEYGAFTGGAVVYDDNTGIDSGQIVFYPFSFDYLKPTMGRWLIENAMAYLLVREPPGPSGITGRVVLAGGIDHGGVSVKVDSLHTAVTGADGSYVIEGLWGGDYSVTASLDGYSSRSLDFHVEEGQTVALADITLSPMTVIEVSSTTPVSIPDNDSKGIYGELLVDTPGTVQGISVTADVSHYSINNLIIKLISPLGTEVTLHNRTGGTVDDIAGTWPDELALDGPGTMDDFLDEDVQGIWQLMVSDNQFGATGRLNSWGLTIQVAGANPSATRDPALLSTRILGNSPNPFNPRTVISFELARTGSVRLDIFDIRGRRVRNLVDGELAAGIHQILWDGLDQGGRASASGMYFTKLHSAEGDQVEKMLLVR